jgi:hypothetical protein
MILCERFKSAVEVEEIIEILSEKNLRYSKKKATTPTNFGGINEGASTRTPHTISLFSDC